MVDKLTYQALLLSDSVDLNTDVCESTWFARSFRATPSTYALHTRNPRKLSPQINTTLSRAGPPESPGYLRTCTNIPFTPSCSYQEFCEDVKLDIARNWKRALNASGIYV
jgi:hypothetical protein